MQGKSEYLSVAGARFLLLLLWHQSLSVASTPVVNKSDSHGRRLGKERATGRNLQLQKQKTASQTNPKELHAELGLEQNQVSAMDIMLVR